MDFKKNLKIGLSCVGKMYLVCAILRNGITCLYGNLTSEYFGVDPSASQDYFVQVFKSCLSTSSGKYSGITSIIHN